MHNVENLENKEIIKIGISLIPPAEMISVSITWFYINTLFTKFELYRVLNPAGLFKTVLITILYHVSQIFAVLLSFSFIW